MSVRAHHLEGIRLLAEIESNTGELYRMYAACLPAHADFWNGLAHEEEAHATWVTKLMERYEAGEIEYQEGRFAPESYRLFLYYLHDRQTEADRECTGLRAALAIAIDIETAFVEKNFLAIFETDDEAIKKTLTQLTKASEEHLRRVASYLAAQ
jgi:rubrerythrin